MSMSEYEERFRAPAPSLHQRFAAMRGPRRERRRIRLFWIAAAVVLRLPFRIAWDPRMLEPIRLNSSLQNLSGFIGRWTPTSSSQRIPRHDFSLAYRDRG
jgi:hypothetical protein